ncbi:MAG TPA: nucleotidyltransferase family protein [Bacillota bacterium]|nr:nucleotidyltransferase family protein [Bacillota bacterium]
MHAIILAGGGAEVDAFAQQHGAANKALININGRPMFEYIFSAITASSRIKDVVIVGPVDDFASYARPGVTVLADSGDITDNCLVGIRSLPKDGRRVVLLTSDIPLVTAEILDTYLDQVSAIEGDLLYPLISQETNEARFPGMKRTYAKLRDGVFTGGNIMVIDPIIAEPIAAVVKRLVAKRKNVLAMGAVAGPFTMLRLATGRLTIAQAERRISQILRCRAVVVRCAFAEIGTDVDKESDLILAAAALKTS